MRSSRLARRGSTMLCLLSCLLLRPVGAAAQAVVDDEPGSAAPIAAAEVAGQQGPTTPRGAVARLLAVMAAGDFERAAESLDLRQLPAGVTPADGARLAEKLNEVLERKLWIDLESLSIDPAGTSGDDLPPTQDLLGRIEDRGGATELFLQRVPDASLGQVWKVSGATVAMISELHARHGEPPIVAVVARWVPDGRFLGVEYAKWTIALAAAALFFLLGRPLLGGLARIVTRDGSPYRWRVRVLLRGPVLLLVIVVMVREVLAYLGIGVVGQGVERAGTMLTVVVVWVLFGLVNLIRDVVVQRMAEKGQRDATALLRPTSSGVKVVILLVAVVTWLDNLGFNVTTLIAGLGVGGIAVALALQRPLEDLVAAVTLYSQQIIRAGDYCHFGTLRGTVEEIGLRTTRLRTIRNTVISIPNSRVVHESIDNFSAREKFLYETLLSLSHETSTDQLRQVLSGLTAVAAAHEKVLEGFRIRFVAFGSVSFDVKVFLYIDTREMPEFERVVEELNLAFMDVVTGADVEFANRALVLPT